MADTDHMVRAYIEALGMVCLYATADARIGSGLAPAGATVIG